MCLLFLKGGVPSHGGIRQVDTIVCCFGPEGGQHRQVRSVLFRDCGSSSQRAGPTTQLLGYHHLPLLNLSGRRVRRRRRQPLAAQGVKFGGSHSARVWGDAFSKGLGLL